MDSSSDITRIPIGAACDVVGESRQTRSNWLDRGLVQGSKSGAISLAELCDFAAVAELAGRLSFDDARIAWVQVRDRARASWQATTLDVVLDLQLKEAVLATTLGEVASAVRHTRAVRVIPLAPVVAQTRAAFDRISTALRETEA